MGFFAAGPAAIAASPSRNQNDALPSPWTSLSSSSFLLLPLLARASQILSNLAPSLLCLSRDWSLSLPLSGPLSLPLPSLSPGSAASRLRAFSFSLSLRGQAPSSQTSLPLFSALSDLDPSLSARDPLPLDLFACLSISLCFSLSLGLSPSRPLSPLPHFRSPTISLNLSLMLVISVLKTPLHLDLSFASGLSPSSLTSDLQRSPLISLSYFSSLYRSIKYSSLKNQLLTTISSSSSSLSESPSAHRSLEKLLEQEKERAMLNQMVAKLTDVCWDKCITGSIGSSISHSEANCLTNCARHCSSFLVALTVFQESSACLIGMKVVVLVKIDLHEPIFFDESAFDLGNGVSRNRCFPSQFYPRLTKTAEVKKT
ncbi:hypothetical protein ACLOJK_013129 [Asimina triloba]